MNKLLFTIILLFGFAFAQAQNDFKPAKDPQAILKKIESASENTKSIQSNFVQYKHLDILENDIESKGVFFFAKPQKVRWEYTEPYPYLIIMAEGRMLIKEGGKVQEYDTENNRVFKEINDLMMSLLSGDIARNASFDIRIMESSWQAMAVLIPKNAEMKQMLQKAELYFDKSNYGISEIIMRENAGDYTRIVFQNRKYNVSIPNSRFMLH